MANTDLVNEGLLGAYHDELMKTHLAGGVVFDISAYNLTNGQPTPYADLAAAIGTNGANIPEPLRKGGMSVKFIQGTVQSPDNNYVQYRYMETDTTSTIFTNVANWQSIESAIDATNGYFVCNTVATNTNKSVNIPGYKLQVGGSIKIKFENSSNTSSVNLNISNTGLKPLYFNGIAAGSGNVWNAGEVLEVFYDGTNYQARRTTLVDVETKANIGYYVCDTLATSYNKTVTAPDYRLIVGGSFKVKFTNGSGNTSAEFNFDFNSRNKYPLYYNGSRATKDNCWEAGEVVDMYFDGEKYIATKHDVSGDINELNTRIDNFNIFNTAIDSVYSNTVTSVSGSVYTNEIHNIEAKAGQIIEVYFDNEICPTTPNGACDIYVKYADSTSYTYLKVYPLGSGTKFILDLTKDITDVKVYVSPQFVVSSIDATLIVKVLNKPFSDSHSLTEKIYSMNIDLTPSYTMYASIGAALNIPAGKRIICKVIDENNVLNNVDVPFYKIRNVSSEPLVIIKPNTISKVITLSETLEWFYVSFRQAEGTSYGTGRVRFEIHVESETSDTIFNKLQDLENSGGGETSITSEYIVSIENPYFCPSYTGNAQEILDREIHGLHVKFDSITFYNGSYRIVKTMQDVFNDTARSAQNSGEYVSGCLGLGTYGSYHQALAFDKETKKFVVTTDTVDSTGKFIYLAYAKNGRWCGEICRQFDAIKENNESVFLRQVRRSYLNTFRDKEIELLSASEYFTFGLCSDVHYSIFGDNGDAINVTNAVMAELDRYVGLDAIINGGDNILYGSLFKKHGLEALRQEFQLVDLNKFIPCVGNHDYNGHGTPYVQKKEWTITDKELETLYFRRCKATYRPDDKLYYYRDFEDKKVRVVVLNTQDVPIQFNNEDEIIYDPINLFGITQSQIDFIVSALDLSTKQSPNDWKIIFAMHVGLYANTEGMMGNGTLINRVVVRNILKAFVNRSTYSYSETDTDHDGIFTVAGNVDFTNANGKLIAVFNGHTHHDVYVNSDGFNCIGIQCSYPGIEHEETAYSLPSMPPMTYREFAIDVVILDDVQQKIILKRFGCHHVIQNPDGDREYSYDVSI